MSRPDILGYVSLNAPDSLQNRFEYNGDATVLYAGYAPRGKSTSDDIWTIHMFTYDTVAGASVVVLKQTAFGAWDDRASLTYS